MYSINSNIVFREVGDRVVLLNPETGYYYSLNEMGRIVFRNIVKKKEVDEILKLIMEKYVVSEEKVRDDITSFISKLAEENILNAT